MAISFDVIAEVRDVQGKGASRRLRHQDRVPAILYGGGQEPEMLQIAHNELLLHLQHEAFYSHILNVIVDGNKQKAVLKDVQRHPAKLQILHVDFMRVSDKDVIKMHVPLHFINEEECKGVKAGGMVSHMMTDIEVLCAAKDLPEYIEVDLANLDSGETIHMSELNMPEGVQVLALTHGDDHDHDLGVVTVMTKSVAPAADEGEAADAASEGDAE
ncbi:MAG: 50S ribosomal protein L25/general stress protein Ctc [Gammaproteobacteria bacterium]